MTDFQLTTPVAFLIFNRPDTTARVFEAIRQAKPPKLLVVADGPRPDRADDIEKCKAARAIIEGVDWDCEVLTNYSGVNLGCKKRVSSGLDWVFEIVEEAIILEDDCLPHPDFFRFCEELLEKYRDDKRIMAIGGTNVIGEWKSSVQSYHFSYHGSIWGWASWRRAWCYFDLDMRLWANQEIRNRVRDVIADNRQYQKRAIVFESVYRKEIDTWDYQWMFARLVQSGLTVIPCVNLVSNLGFAREDATHTKSRNEFLSNLERIDMIFPIKTNEFIAIDRDYDKQVFLKAFKGIGYRIISKISEKSKLFYSLSKGLK
ncbi:glycosyltransferase family A protein [Microcystis aeruginosa CS-555/01A07]|uniref:glycosyltransferase family 2 protein n=1 Tax=Microcystis aeruginosa TaxID=1126 RepID=UPI00232E9D90|nr:glycosyltransferase family A protein [Microcystis aeruginosa]MDB9430534.1 glycosyltransferase family A protein [Microcystis aeruginosa CS-555/01A07]